jgi:cell division protein FtsI (penicillin-binding protein 3)
MARRKPADPLRHRRRALLAVWLLCGIGVLVRAGHVQIVQGGTWAAIADRQQRAAEEIPAPRGRILDREGVPLVETRELYEVFVAPREVRDPEALEVRLVEVLGLSTREARRALDPDRRWTSLGRFPPLAHSEFKATAGVHLQRVLRRDYPQGRMAGGVLGVAHDDGGVGGVEETFDDLLRGEPGRAIVAKDARGRHLLGQVFEMQVPRSGGDLVLTLDADLQEIARATLERAVESTGAEGGDLLVTDPRTGEVLAAVSLKDGEDRGTGFIGNPVEPGSTIKPFTLATLLSNRRGRLGDEIDVGLGRWATDCGRVLHDVGARGVLTLAEAIQVSSNVGVAKAAQALTPAEQYEGLRDFGFGEATGIRLKGESAGRLRTPDQWTCPSAASLAIGYEISVTPLQMAMAYGALANGGLLMEPRIVQEIRYPDGRRERMKPRVVRRVLSQGVADQVSSVLVEVVRQGTGKRAGLSAFTVAGKSGTARLFRDGRYSTDRYFSSFVGYFPAESPQLVIYARLDGVEGYGGELAGPVTRATMEAALASRGTPIQLGELPSGRPGEGSVAVPVRWVTSGAAEPEAPSDLELRQGWASPDQRWERRVPEVEGKPMREAAQTLHALGLRVRVEGFGPVRSVRPVPGTPVMTGDTILLRADPRGIDSSGPPGWASGRSSTRPSP